MTDEFRVKVVDERGKSDSYYADSRHLFVNYSMLPFVGRMPAYFNADFGRPVPGNIPGGYVIEIENPLVKIKMRSTLYGEVEVVGRPTIKKDIFKSETLIVGYGGGGELYSWNSILASSYSENEKPWRCRKVNKNIYKAGMCISANNFLSGRQGNMLVSQDIRILLLDLKEHFGELIEANLLGYNIKPTWKTARVVEIGSVAELPTFYYAKRRDTEIRLDLLPPKVQRHIVELLFFFAQLYYYGSSSKFLGLGFTLPKNIYELKRGYTTGHFTDELGMTYTPPHVGKFSVGSK